jgi:hypothetical protein
VIIELANRIGYSATRLVGYSVGLGYSNWTDASLLYLALLLGLGCSAWIRGLDKRIRGLDTLLWLLRYLPRPVQSGIASASGRSGAPNTMGGQIMPDLP